MALSLKLNSSPNYATISLGSWSAKILIFSVCSPSSSTFRTQRGYGSTGAPLEALDALEALDGCFWDLEAEGLKLAVWDF
jgi:hypothetical protein